MRETTSQTSDPKNKQSIQSNEPEKKPIKFNEINYRNNLDNVKAFKQFSEIAAA